MIKRLIICASVFLAVFFAAGAQEKKPPQSSRKGISGKSTELSEAFEQKKIEPFEYEPIISEFWEVIQESSKENLYAEILERAQKQMDEFGEVTPEGQEAKLALGYGFYKLNYWAVAFEYWKQVAQSQKGTLIGDQAILYIDEMIRKDPMHSEDLYRLFDTYQIENRHAEVQNLAGYFRGLSLLKYGHKNWGVKALSEIDPYSYWGQMYLFWTATALVANDDVEQAEVLFRQLYEKEGQASRIKDLAGLQIARLTFEKGKFEEAFALYSEKRNLGLREKGRLLLEKAWTQFYLGDYGRSMGILHALKSPYFKASQTYEAFILEMLIFRQLCQYDFVKYSADVFKRRFGKSIKRIQARASLKRDPNLFSLAVMDLQLQEKANYISRMRLEEKQLKTSEIGDLKAIKPALAMYKNRLRELQFEMDVLLEPALRKVANQVLRAQEQIKFLQYISSLDALKLSDGSAGETYKASRISNFEFETIYWPVTSEYWFDELEDYSMKISSVCETETDKEQKKLEETFR